MQTNRQAVLSRDLRCIGDNNQMLLLETILPIKRTTTVKMLNSCLVAWTASNAEVRFDSATTVSATLNFRLSRDSTSCGFAIDLPYSRLTKMDGGFRTYPFRDYFSGVICAMSARIARSSLRGQKRVKVENGSELFFIIAARRRFYVILRSL